MSLHTRIIDPKDKEQESTPNQILTYEEALHLAGDQNRYQFRIGFLISIGMALAGLQIMAFSFIFRTPEVQCQGPDGEWNDCLPNKVTCKLPMRVNPESINSVLATFNLYCSGDSSRIIAETSYMIASALGVAVFAPIADRYGKRAALYATYAITCLSLVGCTFSTVWEVFIMMLILSGLGRAPFIYYGFQVLVEVSNQAFRPVGGLIMGVSFASGAALTGALNLLVDYNWKSYYFFFIAIPSILAIPLVYFWADESPMSYFPRYQYDKARKGLMKIARVNKKSLPFFRFNTEQSERESYGDTELTEMKSYTIFDLFRYKSLRGAALGGSYLSFVTYFIFYGQILALDTLTNDPVEVAILTSIVEALSCIASVRFLTKFTRKRTVIISFIITAIAFLLYGLVNTQGRCAPGDKNCQHFYTIIGYIELSFGRFWIAMLMCTTFLYVNELFPTVIRSRGSGLVNFFGRIGSVLPSYAIHLCKASGVSPAIVFGLLSAPGCIVASMMRETKGKPLAHHIEEEEKAELEKKVQIERDERKARLEEQGEIQPRIK